MFYNYFTNLAISKKVGQLKSHIKIHYLPVASPATMTTFTISTTTR